MYSSTHRVSLQSGANHCGYLFRSKEERLLLIPYARARVQCFSIFAFTSSPFGYKSLIDCALCVKASPFCLHRFFATNVVQDVEFQIVAVKVKVNAGFAFTLKRLIYSLLRVKVKGEGKNGKFAESASAYMRVGACPARRIEWDFVRGREVWDKTREEVAKRGEVLRESRLVFFEWSGGGERNNLFCLLVYACFLILSFGFSMMAFCFSIPAVLFQHHLSHFDFTLRYIGHLPVLFLLLCPRFVAFSLIFPLALSFFQRNMSIFISIRLFKGVKYDFFLLFLVCKSRNLGELQAKTPRQTDFCGENRDFGREFLASWREKHPEKGVFCPQSGRIGWKKAVLGEKLQGGDEAKNWALLLILQCYEVAKWAQMNFSRIFFRRSLAGNGEMPYLCTRNREATLLQERVTLRRQRGGKSAAVIFESLT